MRKVAAIIIPILACFFVGLTASYFQADAIKTWYPLLNKPDLTPPNIVFPIAWGIIYLCMGISIGIIFLSNSIKKKELIKLFLYPAIFQLCMEYPVLLYAKSFVGIHRYSYSRHQCNNVCN